MIDYYRNTYHNKSTVKFYLEKDMFLKELKEFGIKSNPIIAFISTSNYNSQKD